MKRLLLLFFIVATSISAAFAEHIAGAFISYRYIADNRYEVMLTYYRDCSSPILANSQETIRIRRGISSPFEDSLVVTRIGERPVDIGNICSRLANQTRCNAGGTINSIERYRYVGTITLPDRSAEWYFSWKNCNRSGQVAPVITAPSASQNCIYVESKLNNFLEDNNSPVFSAEPLLYTCSNTQAILNNNAQDVDGDRLTYQLAPAQYDPNAFFTYNGSFTPQNPMNAANFIINSRGIISILSGNPGMYPYVVVVRAFKGGNLVNEIKRDIVIVVEDCSNTPPTVADAIGDNVFHGDTVVWNYPYTEQTVIINSADIDGSQITSLTAPAGLSNTLAGALVNTIPGRNPGERGRVTITWTPSVSDARTYPVTFTVKDGACTREGVGSRTIIFIVQKPYVLITPAYAYQKCQRLINLGASVRNGTPPYTYDWRNKQGTRDCIINGDSLVAKTNCLGCYAMRVTDHWGQTAITDSMCVIKPYSGYIMQDDQCHGPDIPIPCPYKKCTNISNNFYHVIDFPFNTTGTDYTWKFIRDSTLTVDTVRGTVVDYTWRHAGTWGFSVTFKIDSCYYTDTATITICRKPDLKIEIKDSCNADRYYVLNVAQTVSQPQKIGCGMKYSSEIQYVINTGTVANPIYTIQRITDGPANQTSPDTIRFNAANAVGNSIFLKLTLTNDCGDSTILDTIRLLPRPILWPNPRYDDTLYIAACPTIVKPKVSGGKGPYKYFFERADVGYRSNYRDSSRMDSVRYPRQNPPYPFSKIGNLADSLGGDTVLNYLTRYSMYFGSVTDSAGCTYIRNWRITKAVQCGFTYKQECVGNSFAISVDTIGNAQPSNYNWSWLPDYSGTQPGIVQLYWSWGDGKIDTIPYGAPIVARSHIYDSTGTYQVRLLAKHDSGCIDTASKLIYVETSRPKPSIVDSSLCFIKRTNGVNDFEDLLVYGGLSPGVARWTLYCSNVPGDTVGLNYDPTSNGLIRGNPIFSSGRKKIVLKTRYSNGCNFLDTFNINVGSDLQYSPFFTTRPCSAADSFEVQSNVPDSSLGRVKNLRWDMGDGTIIVGSNLVKYKYVDGQPRKISVSLIDTLGCAHPYDKPKDFDYIPAIPTKPCVQDFANSLCKNVPFAFYIPARCRETENRGRILWSVRGPQNIDTLTLDTMFTRSYKFTGVYSLRFTVFTTDGTCSSTDSVRFIISDEAKLSVNVNFPCEREPSIIDFTASTPSSFRDTIIRYQVYTLAGDSLYNGTSPIYTTVWPINSKSDYNNKLIARIITKAGCVGQDTISLNVRARPIARFSSNPIAKDVKAGDTISFSTLTAPENSDPVIGNTIKCLWDFGDTTTAKTRIFSKIYRYPNIYTVRLIVKNEQECYDTTYKEYDLKAYFTTPTAFTPNGDKINDTFIPKYRGVKELREFKVYNRWGQLIYESPNIKLVDLIDPSKEPVGGWDGKFGGADQPAGVYVIRASAVSVYDTDINIIDKVVLVR